MNLRESFREWSEAWQNESRWILWIWGFCFLAAGAVGWSFLYGRNSAGTDIPPSAARGAATEDSPTIFAALRTAREFPSEPDVWLAAAARLESARPSQARALRRDAALLSIPSPSDRAEAEALAHTASLMAEGRAREALAFLDRLPASVVGLAQIKARRAALLASFHDVAALKVGVLAGDWGAVDSDVLELAFCADLAGRRQDPALCRDLWKVALGAGRDRTDDFSVLIRLGTCLGLEAETQDSFEAGIARDPRDLRLVREYAVWAHRRDYGQAWDRALPLWRKLAPAEAEAYVKSAGKPGPL